MWHDADQQLLFIIHPIIALGPNFYHQTFYRVFAHALYLLRRAWKVKAESEILWKRFPQSESLSRRRP